MKYVRIFLLGLQSNVHYRANTIGWILVGLIPSISFIAVWLTALGNRSNIGGFAKGDFVVYFFFGTIFWYIIGGTYCYQIGNAIKDGSLNKYLLKPINFTFNFFLREQAWKVTALILAIPFVATCLLIFGKDINLDWTISKVVMLLLSILAGATIFALMEAIIGLSAFWFTDLWSMIETNDILMGLFGGRVAPLAIMPGFIQTIANYLPFKYIFYTPMLILLDKSINPLLEIEKQFIFIVILFPSYLLLWHFGLKRYEGIGG